MCLKSWNFKYKPGGVVTKHDQWKELEKGIKSGELDLSANSHECDVMWDQRLKGHLEHELFYVVKAMFWTGKNRGVMNLLSGSYVAMKEEPYLGLEENTRLLTKSPKSWRDSSSKSFQREQYWLMKSFLWRMNQW
ncbi:hypothetical protein Rs2_51093 [Raphanus sativus]|nr:hypothetical protein Rs2_52347 [Raphanus sativus]KAJ4867369.1 hypothetical protein Rs2_51093 [Raphanus sativus]